MSTDSFEYPDIHAEKKTLYTYYAFIYEAYS